MTELDRASTEDIERLDKDPALFERYSAQALEWEVIYREMAAARPGQPVTAYQVSLEQRKRWLARGEKPWWKEGTSHD